MPQVTTQYGFDMWASESDTGKRLLTFRNVEGRDLAVAYEKMAHEIAKQRDTWDGKIEVAPSTTPLTHLNYVFFDKVQVEITQPTWREQDWHVEWRDATIYENALPRMFSGISPASALALVNTLRALPADYRVRDIRAYAIGTEGDPNYRATHGW